MNPLELLLACSLSAPSTFAQSEAALKIPQINEISAGNALACINSALAFMRPRAVSKRDKKTLLKNLTLVTPTNRSVNEQWDRRSPLARNSAEN